VSEIDTQVEAGEKADDEYVNTWSVNGMYYEFLSLRTEVGWGSHEKTVPPGAHDFSQDNVIGQRNIILLESVSVDTVVRSWTPAGEIDGYAVSHQDTFEISRCLSVVDKEKGDGEEAVVYRPSSFYAYKPCSAAQKSIEQAHAAGELQPKQRVMTNEIVTGRDVIGVLLLGHKYKAWWFGSLLSIEETRSIVSDHNATILQVATGVIVGVSYLFRNLHAGVINASSLPRTLLEFAYPFLGPMISVPVDWSPAKSLGKNEEDFDWSLTNFLLPKKA